MKLLRRFFEPPVAQRVKLTGRDNRSKLQGLQGLAARISRGRHYYVRELFLRSRAMAGDLAGRIFFRRRGGIGRAHAMAESRYSKEYTVDLPPAFGARQANIRLSIPALPVGPSYSFSEHVSNDDGSASDRVIACTIGGFAVSEDLGTSWKRINLRGFERFPVVHSRSLPGGEILLLASDSDNLSPGSETSHLIVCRLDGTVQHCARVGPRWHGPRAIDLCGSTLMYAEYPDNDASTGATPAKHRPSRVWRSRDFGRSWEMVREERNIRHFHFLQANPNASREWWLSSGDSAEESRIWKSTDDGDTWIDQTEKFGAAIAIGEESFSRRVFRLTDLTWLGDEIIWGSDDVLRHHDGGAKAIKNKPGSRVFRGNPVTGTAPTILGNCGPEVRNIVDAGAFRFVLTQSTHHLADGGDPRAFVMTHDGSALSHLFDIKRMVGGRTGFTYSRASRRAKDGVFFTFRGGHDVFTAPNRILKWQVAFD